MPKKTTAPSRSGDDAAGFSPRAPSEVHDAPGERTSPPSIGSPAAACPVCDVLGTHFHADFDRDMHLPDATRKLEIVMSFYYDDDMRRCTLCGTYYRFHFETDNDIFQPTHTGEYDRIPAEKAESMIREAKARLEENIAEYRKKMRRVHKAVMATITPVETQVLDYLIRRYCESYLGMQYTTRAEIVKALALDARVVDVAIVHLLETKVAESGRHPTDGFRIKTYRI